MCISCTDIWSLHTFVLCICDIPFIVCSKSITDPHRDMAKDLSSTIIYPGTRAWLEDETLSIRLTKTVFGCIPITIGSKAVELQGVLDYGYIVTNLTVTENVNEFSWLRCCLKAPRTSTFVLKGAIDSNRVIGLQQLPLYRQMGNCDPNISNSLFSVNMESSTYLVVKLVRAKGLVIPSRDEWKENLNTSVTVHWGVMRKGTRVVRNSADPFWDDEGNHICLSV